MLGGVNRVAHPEQEGAGQNAEKVSKAHDGRVYSKNMNFASVVVQISSLALIALLAVSNSNENIYG